jgi:hypothetical protein
LTKASGSGRSSSGAASIAAPAPITAAGHARGKRSEAGGQHQRDEQYNRGHGVA